MAATELNSTSLVNDDHLKAYYRFESGTLTTDSSGEGHTLSAVSDPAEDASGQFGGAVSLDGNDAYSATDHTDFKPTGNFTIGLWFKGTNHQHTLFQSWSQNTALAGIRFYNDGNSIIRLYSGRNTGTTENTDWKQLTYDYAAYLDGNWHFLVGTWDGSNLNIYLDGASKAQTAWANAPAYAATNYVRIGCNNNSGTNAAFFTGSLDDVFLFNGLALSADTIQSLYDGTINSPSSSPSPSTSISSSPSSSVSSSISSSPSISPSSSESSSVSSSPSISSSISSSESSSISESESSSPSSSLSVSSSLSDSPSSSASVSTSPSDSPSLSPSISSSPSSSVSSSVSDSISTSISSSPSSSVSSSVSSSPSSSISSSPSLSPSSSASSSPSSSISSSISSSPSPTGGSPSTSPSTSPSSSASSSISSSTSSSISSSVSSSLSSSLSSSPSVSPSPTAAVHYTEIARPSIPVYRNINRPL